MPLHVLGIALDTDTVSLLQLTGSAKAYDITLAVQHPWPQAEDPEEAEHLQQQLLQELVATHRLQGQTILATLPAHEAVLRNLTLPFKDPRRIRQTLKFALDEHMPFDPEEVVVDFHLLPMAPPNQASLLVAGMLKERVATVLMLLQSVGLDPNVLDLDVFALAHAAVLGLAPLPAQTLLVDVQPTRTLLTLLLNGTPVFARSLTHGLAPDVFMPDANRLSKHVQHTLYACERVLQQPYTPEVLVLSGTPGEHLQALAVALQEAMGTPTTIWRLTTNAYKPGSTHTAPPDLARFAIAFGIAARGMQRQAPGLNLRREEFALHRDIQELRGRLVGLGVLLVFVASLGLGNLYLDTYYQRQHYTQLQQAIEQVFRSTLPDVRLRQPVVQMREKMHELDERLQSFGGVTGAQLSGLQVLKEISARVPPTLVVEVDNLTIAGDTIDLSGTTTSYDDIVKIKDALETSPLLAEVKINNSRQNLNNKVDFKLTIKAARKQENTI
jgi:Tfp pilus assembly PilM family ATPase/Tfp pilus assembly protein PilN